MIPLMVPLALVILVFAGLAIDSAFLTTSKVQQRQLSEYVALESLHTYLQTPGSLDTKLLAVRSRASEITSQNILLGNRMSGSTSGPNDVRASTDGATAGTNGTVYPGIWWYREPTSQAPLANCPAYEKWGQPWTGQFFQFVDLDLFPNCRINSFQAILHFSGDSGIRTTFMRAAGVTTTSETISDAVAATYPRRGVFLVDLSRSTHAETHLPYEAAGGAEQDQYFKLSSEFSFRASIGCAANNTIPAACMPPGTTCDIYGGSVAGLYESLWLSSSVPPPPTLGGYDFIKPGARVAGEPPYSHHRDEYKCYDITYTDPRISATPRTETYFVDMRRDADYLGPEPLTTMLRGVNYGYGLMAQTWVQGDMLGILGFDQSAVIPERRFNLSEPESPGFNEAVNLTDIENDPPCLSDPGVSASVCRVRDKFFISRDRGHSNIAEALQEARRGLIAVATDQPAENFVMLLSDGLGNCDRNRNCGSSDARYMASYTDVQDVIRNQYIPDDIRFHFLSFGDVTGAHTLVVPSPSKVDELGNSTACMTEEEARDHSPPLFLTDFTSGKSATPEATFRQATLNMGGAFINDPDFPGQRIKSQGTRFYSPNQLFELTRDSQGRWFPTRPPCRVGGVNTNIQNNLKTACTGKTFSQTNGRPTAITVGPFTDNFGRLLCDPEGLIRMRQVTQAMDVVLGRSPYIIVQ